MPPWTDLAGESQKKKNGWRAIGPGRSFLGFLAMSWPKAESQFSFRSSDPKAAGFPLGREFPLLGAMCRLDVWGSMGSRSGCESKPMVPFWGKS